MSIFDKFLRLRLIEDLTETTVWTEAVFRALAEDEPDEYGIDSDIAANEPSTKPTYQ